MDSRLFDYDIIIQGGQSNAEGFGAGAIDNEYIPNENVYFLEAEKTVEHLPERVVVEYANKDFDISIAKGRESNGNKIVDFSLFFARKYIESGFLSEGRKLLIIRAAVGGTGFKKGNWGMQDLLYKKMLEMTDYALSLNKNNRVVAFLWHQGEHDAVERNNPLVFENQLSQMVNSVRSRYGKMPFIAGDFVNEWKQKNIEICTPIVEKMQKVANDIGLGAFINTEDLLSNNQKIANGDDIHFCGESLSNLGERYFDAYSKLVQ